MPRTETEMDDTALSTVTPFPAPAESRTAVSLVSDNLVAFALRAAGARAATRTLDLQYYIWDEDVTGRLLAWEVLRAADRGVRVRLLLDDLYVRRTERALATLAQHPGIEVRLYNPFHLRSWGALGNALEFLFAGYRLNHRMHNKTWIVDGQLAIGGGRNIGDEYFDAAPASSTSATLTWRWRAGRPIRHVLCSTSTGIALGCGYRGEVAAVRRSEGELDELRRRLESAASSAPCAAYPGKPERLARAVRPAGGWPRHTAGALGPGRCRPARQGARAPRRAPDVLDAIRDVVDAAGVRCSSSRPILCRAGGHCGGSPPLSAGGCGSRS